MCLVGFVAARIAFLPFYAIFPENFRTFGFVEDNFASATCK